MLFAAAAAAAADDCDELRSTPSARRSNEYQQCLNSQRSGGSVAAPAAARSAASRAAAATSSGSTFMRQESTMMGIEWLKPGVFFGSILYALIGVLVFWISFVDHRQAHAVRPVGRDRREEEPGAGDRRRRDVHRDRADRRGGDPRLDGRGTAGAGQGGEGETAAARARAPRRPRSALLASVFVVAACGLVYELAAGALASYLLGDSVLQFSHRHRQLPVRDGRRLVAVALRRAPAGRAVPAHRAAGRPGRRADAGGAVRRCTACCRRAAPFRVLLYALVLLVGVLVGLEIPLVMRILKRHFSAALCAEGAGVAGADLRLPRRAGGVGRVPAAAGAAARAGAHRRRSSAC